MLLRILKNSVRRRPRGLFLVFLSIVMGGGVATAFLGIRREISHKMALELRGYGANILVEPAAGADASLREADLAKIGTVFWKHNIIGYAPYLYGVAEFVSERGREKGVLAGTWFAHVVAPEGEEPAPEGVRVIAPWWSLTGSWPAAADEAVMGAALARRLGVAAGDTVTVLRKGDRQRLRVVGVVSTGGYEEEELFAPLATVQDLLGRKGEVSRVLVSALTVPMDDFGRKNPATMAKAEYEKWYCTAYVTSVAKNIEEVMTGSRARPIWRIAGAEGALLSRLDLIMLLLTGLALAAAATAVSTALLASMAERSREIALMKTMGADRFQVGAIFFGETAIVALCGGLCGYFLGERLAVFIIRTVFHATLDSPAWLFPIALLSALAVAVAGSVVPVRRALVVEPVKVLRG